MQPVPAEQKQNNKRKYCVTRFALRTKLLDDMLLDAVHDNRMSQQQLQPARQVVVLGAGMDTRPWRLQLPQGRHSCLFISFMSIWELGDLMRLKLAIIVSVMP